MTRKDWRKAFQLAAPGADRKRLYNAYINSSAWNQSTARLQVINRSGGVCEYCHRHPGKQVHHLHYRSIGAERPEDLLHVCLICHDLLHTKPPRFP